MGCMYACTCGGNCMSCGSYQREEYFGQAEDLLAQMNGYHNASHWAEEDQRQNDEEARYYAEMEAEYCREMLTYYRNAYGTFDLE